jgi:hypothetical protein
MRAIIDALFDRLEASAVLASGLASYRGELALFAADTVPADAPRPYATIFGPVGASAFDTKTGARSEAVAAGTGHILALEVSVYADAEGDPRLVDELAEAAQLAIHRQHAALAASGWAVLVASAQAPVIAPTDDSIYGRRVPISLIVRKA